MIRSVLLVAAIALHLALPARAQTPVPDMLGTEQYLQDFDNFWEFVRDEYAYFHVRQTDWQQVRTLFRPRAAEAISKREFLAVLEQALEQLYDPHAHLGVNSPQSRRMVPSGTDLRAEWRGERAVITDVRSASRADSAGLRPGMEIVSVDDVNVREAARRQLPVALRQPDPAAWHWALQAVLAGRHETPVRLKAQEDGAPRAYEFRPGNMTQATSPLTWRVIDDSLGYIRVNNSLGNTDLISAFDSALVAVRATAGLILDLRDTPGGGTTTVARAIMSRLITSEQPYQRHELPSEERRFGVRRVWVEHVAPRGPFAYERPLVVLVGPWTGSMGEGLAIGLDGMRRATVVGTAMAGLLGALYERRLPNTGFVVRIPAERLFHIDGSPRENFSPRVVVSAESGHANTALDAAVRLLTGSD